MKTFFKKVLSVITALACLAPAAAISVSADAATYTYTFETLANNNTRIVDIANSKWAAIADGSFEWIDAGLGENQSKCVKLIKKDGARALRFTPLAEKVQAVNMGEDGELDALDAAAQYIVASFKIYVDDSKFDYVSISNGWGDSIAPRLSVKGTTVKDTNNTSSDMNKPLDVLEFNQWNNVTYVIQFNSFRDLLGYAYFDTRSDIYVNGRSVAANKQYYARNPVTSDKSDAEKNTFASIDFTLGSGSSDYTNSFYAYIDDIGITLSDTNPLESLPKLVATEKYTVNDNGTISAIPGTVYNDISVDFNCSYEMADSDGFPLAGDDTLADGDVITVTNGQGISVSYTVTLLPAELSVPANYISYSNGGAWPVYKSTDALIEDTYCYPAAVLNTTGETVNITTIVALYEEDGTLVELAMTTKPVVSKAPVKDSKGQYDKSCLTEVRTDLNVTDKLGNGNRYLKAFIWDMNNMKNISRTSPQY